MIRSALFVLALSTAAAEQLKLACMGDSITSPDAWPEELELDKDDWDIDNYGVGGRTVNPRIDRNYRSTTSYKKALREGFDVLVINLGTNDAQYDLSWKGGDQFKKDYKKLVEDVFDNADAPRALFFGIPTPVVSDDSKWDRDVVASMGGLVRDVRKWAQKTYPDTYFGVIDFYAALGGEDPPDDYFEDAVHPTEKGYKRMAWKAEGVLTEWREGASESDASSDSSSSSSSSDSSSSSSSDEYPPTYRPTRRPVYPPTYRPTPRPRSESDSDYYAPTYRPTPRPRESSDSD
mmetsp:Transcript_5105/g.15119  ORF Transcript_5105/g.15119 Transcript_5105/m.15119 type:complete len:291 (+) Transcript_5105:260-1132(+)